MKASTSLPQLVLAAQLFQSAFLWHGLALALEPFDSDGDGLPNAWEVARGLDPLMPIALDQPVDGVAALLAYHALSGANSSGDDLIQLVLPSDENLEVVYHQRRLLSNDSLGLEWSPTLDSPGSWQTLDPVPAQRLPLPAAPDFDEVRHSFDAAMLQRGFFRLSASHTVPEDRLTFPLETLPDIEAAVQARQGNVQLQPGDLVAGRSGNGLRFNRNDQQWALPVANAEIANVNPLKGEIAFWYRPSYGAGDPDDTIHPLFVVGQLDNAPHISLIESDRLRLQVLLPDWSAITVESAYREPLWAAGEWVHLHAIWDSAAADDSLCLLINGQRVSDVRWPGGWALGDVTALGQLQIGAGSGFIADGVIDELRVSGGATGTGAGGGGGTPGNGGGMDGRLDESDPTAIMGAALPESMLTGDWGEASAGNFEEITLLQIRNDRDFDRTGELASAGIPIARDTALTNVDTLAVIGPNARRIAAQFDVISRWGGPPDAINLPIRWLQITTPVDVTALSDTVYSLRRYATAPATVADPFAATIAPAADDADDYVVDTGLARYRLDPNNPALFEEIAVRTTMSVPLETIYRDRAGAGPRLAFESPTGPMILDTQTPGQVTVDTNGFEIVESGPARVVVAMHGHWIAPDGIAAFTIQGARYERFGFTLVATFCRGERDLSLQFHVRNERSTAFNPPWDDEGVRVIRASWEFPFAAGLETASLSSHSIGADALQSWADARDVTVAQNKGSGSPWTRQAQMRSGGVVTEAAETFARPFVGVSDQSWTAGLHLGWMRYREPQALAYENGSLSLRVVSENLMVGEGKGLWNRARLSLCPTPSDPSVALTELNRTAYAQLERGLLVRAPRAHVNASSVLPSLGTNAASDAKTAYRNVIRRLHDETVREDGQWERAKTYGSQLWPDVQRDPWGFDNNISPETNDAAMNYWNPSGAELLEFLRTGDPQWVWDFALPQSWLQMFTAYLNIGDYRFGNRAGFAVNSGGTEEGHWHRGNDGSDDYSYNVGMHLAYALQPCIAFRQRFAQAGDTVVRRYNLSKARESDREAFLNEVAFSRQAVQHFEMLANAAEFVPSSADARLHAKLMEVMGELGQDNLQAGVFCQADVPGANPCPLPQQFMKNAMMYPFIYRLYRNYDNLAPASFPRALFTDPRTLLDHGIERTAGSTAIAINGGWAARMSVTMDGAMSQVVSAEAIPDSDRRLTMYVMNKPHTLALLLMGHEIDASTDMGPLAVEALDQMNLEVLLSDAFANQAGWWKAASQVMQGLVHAIGIADDIRSNSP